MPSPLLRTFIFLNILILIPRRLERHVYDPVAPVVHDTKDRTRHQLHSLLVWADDGFISLKFMDDVVSGLIFLMC